MDIILYVASILVVLAIAYVSLSVLKRLPQDRRPANELTFLSALPVGQRERLVLINWGNRSLLLGVTAGAITLIDQRPTAAVDKTTDDDRTGAEVAERIPSFEREIRRLRGSRVAGVAAAARRAGASIGVAIKRHMGGAPS